MTTLEGTGTYLVAKYKAKYERDGVDREGRPVKRISLRVLYLANGPDAEETASSYISVPFNHQPEELEEGQVYNFPVRVSTGKDGKLYYNLSAHTPISRNND